MAAILDPRPIGASGATTPTGMAPAVLRLVREAPPASSDSPRSALPSAHQGGRLIMRWVPVLRTDGSQALTCRWVADPNR